MIQSLEGAKVVVTGRIAGESRLTAESRLRAAGAHVQSAVSGTTDLLVAGVDTGKSKLAAAERHGVAVVSWADVLALIEGHSIHPAPAPVPATAAPAPLAASYRQIAPMRCKAADELPTGARWLYEIKWDGHRCVAHVDGAGGVRLDSRNGNDYTERFAQVAAELGRLPVACVLDGELVALDERGNSSLESLGDGTARFMAFDIVSYSGSPVESLTLEHRRSMLERVLREGGLADSVLVGVSPGFDDGETLLAWAREQSLEGIVCKLLDSTYQQGARPSSWLKVKIRHEQEFVVLGWTPGEGEREGRIGALVVGYYDPADGGWWKVVGKVGTGLSDAWWDAMQQRLRRHPLPMGEARMEIGERLDRADQRVVRWVVPDTIVQVAFQRWTKDGALWHPSVKGTRDDKEPTDVLRDEVTA